ncbi:MAG: hypothetical protein ABDH28_03110 [Brevinematia bacterium]
MKKVERASALIVALMMVLVLSVVSVSLLSFIGFYYLDSSRLYESEKLKMISEKEVFETIALAKSGIIVTNVQLRTNTDNFVYKVWREVFITNNIYEVVLKLESAKSSVKRNLTFYVLFPTDFCYINLSKLIIQTNTKCVFWGYSFLGGIEGEAVDTFFAFSYLPVFSNITNMKVASYIASARISPETPSLDLNIRYRTNLVNTAEMKISVDELLKKVESMVEKEWIISRHQNEIVEVLNPLSSEKKFLGSFSYANPKIKVDISNVGNIYFSEKLSSRLTLDNSDTLGSRGEITRKFVGISNGYLFFVTTPVEVLLPPEAFYKPFSVKLNSSHTRIVGKYRKITGIYFDNTNENLLNNKVLLRGDAVEIVSEELRGKYYVSIGKGDGIRRRFRIGNISPQKVFIGDREARGFFVEDFHLIFTDPPEDGKEVIVMTRIPRIFVSKALPPDGIYVFSDKVERAVVLDFDRIQNLPKNGVIFSHLPVVVKGSPNEPVVVASRKSIYVDEINNIPNAKTIVLISGEGVFLKEQVEVLRNIFIVSRLDGLYRLTPARTDDVSGERSKWVFGTVVLTGELRNGNLEKTSQSYIFSYENPINSSTFSISERVAKDYLSQSDFGRNIRDLIPPMAVVTKVK